jgi:hypothetical protein
MSRCEFEASGIGWWKVAGFGGCRPGVKNRKLLPSSAFMTPFAEQWLSETEGVSDQQSSSIGPWVRPCDESSVFVDCVRHGDPCRSLRVSGYQGETWHPSRRRRLTSSTQNSCYAKPLGVLRQTRSIRNSAVSLSGWGIESHGLTISAEPFFRAMVRQSRRQGRGGVTPTGCRAERTSARDKIAIHCGPDVGEAQPGPARLGNP